MGKDGICQREQDMVSVLRELWLVRETDTHAKRQSRKRDMKGLEESIILARSGGWELDGAPWNTRKISSVSFVAESPEATTVSVRCQSIRTC